MPAASVWPAIETLLPHRPPMLLIDNVREYDTESICVQATPDAHAWYADAHGNMPVHIVIELMAQAIAAHEALTRRLDGQPPAPGVLLGTRRLDAHVASLRAGVPVLVHATCVLRDGHGNGAYDCRVEADGALLVDATIKVHQPTDFSAFLMESQS
jgi:predicted hotdog family 3-hydroxylacyl-ACP dehydratase